jgi:hypothetical protein
MAYNTKVLLTADEVSSMIDYDPEAGTFTWKISPAKNIKAGTPAGCEKGVRVSPRTGKETRYTYIRMKNYEIPAARVAWLLAYGEWPEGNILFDDGDTTNFRLENLREAKFSRITTDPQTQKKKNVVTRSAQRNYALTRYYGLTLEEYDAKLEAQNGVCAICKGPEIAIIHGKLKPLSVDHNHETGAVRDLLCSHCNHMIGHAAERIEVLRSAISYLEKHAACATEIAQGVS